MKTIARTATRKIAAIAATITAVKVYDQATGNFQPSTIDAAFATLRNNKNARLVDMENGTYQVNVHSNHWYVLDTKPAAEVKQTAAVAPVVTVTRTRVAIGTQIAEACAALGIELGHDTDKGLPCYVVNGEKYTAGELADLVLAGGFDAAYGRATTVVRDDSPLATRVTDSAQAEAAAYAEAAELDAKATAMDHLLPGFTARRAALLRIAEHGGAIAADGLESGMGDALVRAGLVQRVIGPAPEGFAFTAHGRRVADLLAEVEPLEIVPIGHPARLVGPAGPASEVFEIDRAPDTEAELLAALRDRNSVATLVEPEILDMMATAREITGRFLEPAAAPFTVDAAGEKIAAEYGDALTALGREGAGQDPDARAKAHPYRPAVGELVVGTLVSTWTGKQIGGLTIGAFDSLNTRYGLAILRDGGAVLSVDIDSMRPAPVVPDASHLVGRKITANLAVGPDGDTRTGIVREVLRPSADGRYVVVQFETDWIVRVPVSEVAGTAPRGDAR